MHGRCAGQIFRKATGSGSASVTKAVAKKFWRLRPATKDAPGDAAAKPQLSREELYQRIWSAPAVQVATELGISDVALGKRCKKLNVPKPPPGYWAKVAGGLRPEQEPLPPPAMNDVN